MSDHDTYPRLPEPPGPEPDQTLIGYGAALLRFVLAENITATLTDKQLELIDHMYPLAQAAPDLTPATRARLTAARHDVLAALARRRQPLQATTPAPRPTQEIPGGQLARLHPPAPTQPPPTHYAPALRDF